MQHGAQPGPFQAPPGDGEQLLELINLPPGVHYGEGDEQQQGVDQAQALRELAAREHPVHRPQPLRQARKRVHLAAKPESGWLGEWTQPAAMGQDPVAMGAAVTDQHVS